MFVKGLVNGLNGFADCLDQFRLYIYMPFVTGGKLGWYQGLKERIN